MNTCRVCLIEDDEVMGGALSLRLELEGIPCDWLKTARGAQAALRAQAYTAVISDILLPDSDGETLYRDLLESDVPLPPFIFITGHGAVDQAVRLLKLGAVDYLLKPFEPDVLLGKLKGLMFCGDDETSAARTPLGISPAMQALEALLPRLADSQATVLISGESGAGKEVVARRLHQLAHPDSAVPFIAVNCGGFTDTLLEAELFGYEKGAFTGAIKTRKGMFEQAQGGTLFLDEIGDTSAAMQVKLLRVLQERNIRRIGGETDIAVDFRLITATHQDLKEMVASGAFREDLYYRVNVVRIRVPPLRERHDDILWLAGQFLDELSRGLTEQRKLLNPAAEQALLQHPWPGNVRELRHVLEHAHVLAKGPVLTKQELFDTTTRQTQPQDTLGDYLSGQERDYILRALDSQSWQIQETANLLGISRKNLWEKMKKLDIQRP